MFDRGLGLIVEEVTDLTARGLAGAVNRLITSSRLAVDQQLPPVRDIAKALGCSPTTVNDAWQILARSGAIDARGRSGTFVRPSVRASAPSRYRRVTQRSATFAQDLSTGTPDPELLPDLRRALARIGRDDLTSSYLDRPVLPELESALRAVLPYEPESLTVLDGALDALDRIASSTIRHGDRVLVESCAFPPLLDLLTLLGADLIAVDVDAEGIVVESLAAALVHKPVALFSQPRAHNPLGTSTTTRRSVELAAVLSAAPRTLVVEDDHSGAISAAKNVSLGGLLPDAVLHITSFSKSHGPDLRLACVAGPAALIEPLADRRTLGPGWSSRILQAVLAHLLADRVSVGEVAGARDEYKRRRVELCNHLDSHGVAYTGADGINLWVEVDNEQDALVSLAAQGIAVSPGSPFVVAPDGHDHVRVTSGLVRQDHEVLARHLASAARSRTSSRGR